MKCCGDLCVLLQGEAERAPSGEAEVGGENYGPIQSSGAQHATFTVEGQVLFNNTVQSNTILSVTPCKPG